MTTRTYRLAGVLVAALVGMAATAAVGRIRNGPPIPADVQARLKPYPSAYYTVYSDLEPAKVQLAIARLTAVAEEYHERTKTFGGKITQKWPFYMIADPADFKAAGGQAAGNAWGDRLVILAAKKYEKDFWHVIQHEAWHQFAHEVITENLPGWIDEGLAEYFGESLWTGDGLACGVIPKARYARFMPRLREGKIRPFKEIILIRADKWAGIDAYDQALTMVHFMLHAEGGKYQKALTACLNAAVAGKPPEAAFAAAFGPDFEALEKEYLAYWTALPPASLERPYRQATVATMAAYLARAKSQGQKFAAVEDFFKAAADGSLKASPKQPLPEELLADALGRAQALKEWSLEPPPGKTGLPKLILRDADGTVYTATLTPAKGQADKVKIDVKEGVADAAAVPPAPAPVTPGKAVRKKK